MRVYVCVQRPTSHLGLSMSSWLTYPVRKVYLSISEKKVKLFCWFFFSWNPVFHFRLQLVFVLAGRVCFHWVWIIRLCREILEGFLTRLCMHWWGRWRALPYFHRELSGSHSTASATVLGLARWRKSTRRHVLASETIIHTTKIPLATQFLQGKLN